MGTIISLEIEGSEICSAKNHMGIDYGQLFQETDKKQIPSNDAEGEQDINSPYNRGFERNLGSLKTRLDLLGFSLDRVEREYKSACITSREQDEWLMENNSKVENFDRLMNFPEFMAFLQDHPVNSFEKEYHGFESNPSIKDIPRLVNEFRIKRLPYYGNSGDSFTELGVFLEMIEFLSPYAILRALSEVKENADSKVTWLFGPLAENGWADHSDFYGDARRTDRFLVATEGSSDVHILKKAFRLLRPDVIDFFSFIDCSEAHPFSGAGNLVKFANGLVKIDCLNKVLFLLDNDAEGVVAKRKIQDMNLPVNMRATTLPNLDDFESFRSLGPTGIESVDINGKAVAIECFLDLRDQNQSKPHIRWTSYKKEIDEYQGELVDKESFAKSFLKGQYAGYDFTKLTTLLDHIISQCCMISSKTKNDMSNQFEDVSQS